MDDPAGPSRADTAGHTTHPQWQCPREAIRAASEWIASLEQPPDAGEFNLDQHEAFAWRDRRRIDATQVNLAAADALREHGLHPHWAYHTAPGLVRFDWEVWLSEDGITSASMCQHDGQWEVHAFETRFEGPGLLAHTTTPIPGVSWIEASPMPVDVVAAYVEHRRHVADRVEHGAVPLAVVDDHDELAWRNYYTFRRFERAENINDDGFAALSKYFGWILGLAILFLCVIVGNVIIHWDEYTGWLWVWWPLAILIVLPRTLTEYAALLFKGNLNRLDHKFPDDLDEHAGFWIKGKIREAGLSGTVEVARAKESLLSGLDAYLPLREKIVLGERTYPKQDPAFWAIAAHELGHAITYNKIGPLGGFSLMCRTLVSPAHSYVIAALLMNSLFGWAAANHALFWLIGAAVFLGSVVLIDEAVASIIGMRILRSDDRIDTPVLGELRTHLALAWLTYFAGTAAMIGLLIAWPWLASFIEATADFQPAESLIPEQVFWPNVMAAVVGVTVVVTQAWGLVNRIRRFSAKALGEPDAVEAEPAPRPMFCARCGEKFEAHVQDCPRDGAPLVDVGPDDAPLTDEPPNVKIGLGCLGILTVVGAMIGFGVMVWDQPLGDDFRVAVFLYGALVAPIVFAPVAAFVHFILGIPKTLIEKFGVLPEPPPAGRALRSARAAADVATVIAVIDPRERGPWYLSLNPGLWFFTLPLVVLWFMAQS